MADIPTYSLLQPHEDLVQYRTPDTVRGTSAWIKVGLFSWELEGVPLGRHLSEDPSEEEIERAVEKSDGVGLHIGFHAPNRHYPNPRRYDERVKEAHDVFSSGSGGFRIEGATPAELRQTARWIAVYAFSYWWWVDEHTDYQLGKRGTTEQNRSPRLETVQEDGTVVERDGTTHESPYELSDIELRMADEWESPYEKSVDAVRETVDELLEQFPEATVAEAVRDVEDGIVSAVEKTEEKKQREELESAIRDGDGVGFQTRMKIVQEFETLEELCEDIRTGSDRLRDLHAIGESREEEIIDALIESGAWIPDEDASDE